MAKILKLVTTFVTLLSSFAVQAATLDASLSCRNFSDSITTKNSIVKVVTPVQPRGDGTIGNMTFNLDFKDLNIDVVEEYSKAPKKITLKKIIFSKLNGEKMPDAYGLAASADGTLTDLFICEVPK